ncbi:uncharacterized protein B0I36DRAFT_355818 [Microdochium trichocladiopsis]|uniref:Uncharacterized protein n=1 Tax=Microdochium trichocladiopsis TaxID=1682393 RepID=A0A9P8XSK5_9PEZI|nr:uncharacterized protein B0I36DRAFT_355818 [Microdochium trichocladiopsis]KAH7014634.1 hypothetical protein B0I36DRAFT_355818 [Microdochium trichocladiopsis]
MFNTPKLLACLLPLGIQTATASAIPNDGGADFTVPADVVLPGLTAGQVVHFTPEQVAFLETQSGGLITTTPDSATIVVAEASVQEAAQFEAAVAADVVGVFGAASNAAAAAGNGNSELEARDPTEYTTCIYICIIGAGGQWELYPLYLLACTAAGACP